jgi:DNA replication protein DnaC
LTRVLKTPTIGRCWQDLADQAREENWSHEEYLAAVLQRQVAERESAGTTMRIRTAHFPAVKTLEDFNLDHLPSLRRDVLAHLATGTFIAKAENVILLGTPGVGKTHIAQALAHLAIRASAEARFIKTSRALAELPAATPTAPGPGYASWPDPPSWSWTTWPCASSPPPRSTTSMN